ncbi:MAG: hypothetical protein FJ319_08475 [SAR202 cluster bacterium]|nr:hypothetical protein [SAR202 cluster bacterium]
MSLTVSYSAAAKKDIHHLGRQIAVRVLEAIERYAETGYGDVRRLKGTNQEFRLRVGDVRVRFTIDYKAGIMQVIRVLPRDKAYRD